MRSFELLLFADYFQFYIQDEMAIADISDAWDNEAFERMLATAPGVVAIGTARNMDVPVTLEIHDVAPDDDFATWDHVVEANLDVASGRIAIAGCTDYFPDAMRVELAPGSYRVRASYGALDQLSEDDLSGDDRYRLQLWPTAPLPVRVLKRRSK
jgi:hypothetical protein